MAANEYNGYLASRLRLWALAFTGALIAALLVAGQTYVSMLDHGHSWWRLFLWQLGCWSPWAFLAPWLIQSGARLVQRPHHGRLWLLRQSLRHAGLAVTLTGAHLVIAALITTLLQPYEPVAIWGFLRSLYALVVPWTSVDLLIYCLLIASGYGLAAALHKRRLELRESRLEAELVRAELEALRLEIQPHFLFNTLNSIAALVRKKANGRALDMIVGLGELLRVTLDSSDNQRVPLSEELEFIRRYVDLERARFSDRLAVFFDVPNACRDLLVPTLLLQPLVENAIRHGITPRAEAGSVRIGAAVVDERLQLAIVDDGPGLKPGFHLDQDQGVGLGNTRSRLAQLYGDEATLEVASWDRGGTRVVVTLPCEAAAIPATEGAAG